MGNSVSPSRIVFSTLYGVHLNPGFSNGLTAVILTEERLDTSAVAGGMEETWTVRVPGESSKSGRGARHVLFGAHPVVLCDVV